MMLAPSTATEPPAGALTAAAWRADDFDFWAFDRRVDEAAPLVVWPGDDARFVAEVRTRMQRVMPRRTPATAGAWFDRVLAVHRAWHARADLDRPLVRADLDHALDAWQWAVRLDGDAPAEVQLAVLLHDIERLASEADARVEHRAADYQAFKDAHARAGAAMARALLGEAEVAPGLIDAAAGLIAVHERPGAAPGLTAVNDADALSFFSFNAPGYLAYFGPAQTRAKVAYTLGRMSPRARRELPALRLPGEIRAALGDAAR